MKPAQTPITINNRNYVLENLPKKVQALLQYHSIWEADLAKQRLEAAKTEAALRDIQREILAEMTQIENLVDSTTQNSQEEADK
jgi:hypothetical protein